MATKKVNARLRATQAVLELLNLNAVITGVIPALTTLIAELATSIDVVLNTENLLTIGHKQITADKNALKKQMAKLTANLYNVYQLYRKQNSIGLLDLDMTINSSTLAKLRDNTFVEKVTVITQAVNTDIASIGTYGITAANVTAITSQIPIFETFCNNIKLAIASKKNQNTFINQQINQTYEILEAIDVLIETLRPSEPSFVGYYFNARIIHEEPSPIKNGTISGSIVDSFAKLPLTQLKISLLELGLSTKTNKLGLFEFKNIPSGTYTAKTESKIYLPKEIHNIMSKQNKVTKTAITLTKGIVAQNFGIPSLLQTTGTTIVNKPMGTYNPNNILLLKNQSPLASIHVWGSKIANSELNANKTLLEPNQELIITSANLGEADWTFLNLKSLEQEESATLSIQLASTSYDQILPLLR